ncbi:OsmC family protein [Guyparkeria sp.]|uniref:OsmC family protein n=1 Tax=Chromatiales TaxID=135613 RepID=UPI0039707871
MNNNDHDANSLTLCRTTRGHVRILNPCGKDPVAGIDQDDQGDPLRYNPVQHLAIALGCCMTEFARRYLERRNLPTNLIATVDWELDSRHCRISRFDIRLRLAVSLPEEERPVLGRMMNHCPVHQALHGNVPVHIYVEPLNEEEWRRVGNT